MKNKRIFDYGEVFTSQREVKNMIDLVEYESYRIDSKFLEPACGTGNFLIEVLKNKLEFLEKNFCNNQYEFENNSVIVIGSIYGIELLIDNVIITRNNLYKLYLKSYKKNFKENLNDNLLKSINYILDKNIVNGNALSLKQATSNTPIVFSEWSRVMNSIKRRDFSYKILLDSRPFEVGTLFNSLGEDAFIVKPIKEYPLTNYDQIYKYEN